MEDYKTVIKTLLGYSGWSIQITNGEFKFFDPWEEETPFFFNSYSEAMAFASGISAEKRREWRRKHEDICKF